MIVDSTPLLAVTDAAVLAAGADGVLMMARYGRTKREELAHAIGSLQGVGAPMLGTVFTMLPTRGGSSVQLRLRLLRRREPTGSAA